MASSIGKQIITIFILPNISRSKGYPTMKYGQLIIYNVRYIFLEIPCRKWGRKTTSRLIFKNTINRVKTSGRYLSFNIFWYFATWTYDKNKVYKTSDCWFKDMLNFDFLNKCLRLVSPPHFEYDFSNKYALCYNLLVDQMSNVIVWWCLFLEILVYCNYLFTNWCSYKFKT